MPVDVAAARRFLYGHARLLECHRAAVLFDTAPTDPVRRALRAYRNDDGGFGHGLEPDVRTPRSETTAALHALEVLAGVGALDDPVVADAAAWIASVSGADGGVPFALPGVEAYPHGPWMVAAPGGSHLTFGLVAVLAPAGVGGEWLTAATAWCWGRLEGPAPLDPYSLKFALDFLDATPDEHRARTVLERLRPALRADGSVPVPGGTENEKLTPLTLSPRPHGRSRTLFTEAQLAADLDALEAGQHDDGGWTVDYLPWSPAQAVEWRGIATLDALVALRAHGR
jgi:hypothetical protein